MKSTLVHSALLVGLGVLAAPACSAHHPGAYHQRGDYTQYARGQQRAYDRGFHQGVEAGARDWKRRQRFDPWRDSRYRSADSGYSSRYGPRQPYGRAYREGFRAGYERGYGPRGRGHGRPRY